MDHLLSVRRQVLDGITAIDAVKRTLDGQADLSVYQRYLKNVYYYACHSAAVIAVAGSRCVTTHPNLAHYLMRHANEELGHEKWALNDLVAIGVPEAEVRASRPVPACAAMVGFEYLVAEKLNPVGIFGWLYTLEAMGNDLGGRIGEAMKASIGKDKSGVKFIEGHGIADHDHTDDLTRVISHQIKDPADRADVDFVADVVADLYVRMFEQIAQGHA
jgi:pyrroloquinoline quinone (PQQ) biosynthesis protein C